MKVIYSKQEVFGQSKLVAAHLPQVELSPVESTTKAVQLALESEVRCYSQCLASYVYIEVLAENILWTCRAMSRFLVIGQQYSALREMIKHRLSLV